MTQDTSLLHRSIRDNILYGRPEAGEAAMREAARQAHAEEFVPALSDHYGRSGFDAHVGERGAKLSGGQRQRVAIARVLLKDAPILFLDEATSALDSEVEAAIQQSFYQLMEGKTVIAIAHRLSTIAAMDRLVVLDRGRIIETGRARRAAAPRRALCRPLAPPVGRLPDAGRRDSYRERSGGIEVTPERETVFAFFERLIDPYPEAEPKAPPRGLIAFSWHYARPLAPWLIVMAVLTALISVVELVFFAFIGNLVDWLGATDRQTFFADHGVWLIAMALIALVVFPLLSLSQSLVKHQGMYGTFPMLIRWLAHRYILGQSISFFHNEFAGRISQKVMQTALAVRESIFTLLDVDRLRRRLFPRRALPDRRSRSVAAARLLVWLAMYAAILVYFVPRLQQISSAQSDARAQMTGRIVDSYTNIQTIKLFAHTLRERDYARDAMDEFMVTVHRQMRLVTQLTLAIQTRQLAAPHRGRRHRDLCLAGIGGHAWAPSPWRSRLVMRIRAMSHWILWEVAGLFENIGTVQDGINTIAQPTAVNDAPDAKALVVSRGEIRFEHVRFHYGRRSGVHRGLRPDHRARREGRAGRPFGRRQVDARQPAAALLRPRRRAHPHRRPGHRRRARRNRSAARSAW